MIAQGHLTPGKTFWKTHSQEHEATYGHDLEELSRLALPAHVEDNNLAKLFRGHKYRVRLPLTTKNLLLHFLEETADDGGQIVLRCLNQFFELVSLPGRASLFDRGVGSQEDEGIQGHSSGQGDAAENLPTVRLGSLPMDKDLAREVEDELREEDSRMKDVSRKDRFGVPAGTMLLDEFHKIKREESEDSPVREIVPLPPYTTADINHEVNLVKESRDMIKLQGGPYPTLASVCMYTFHSTYDG